MEVEINKDIDRYSESVVMGLTLKQCAFSILSIVVGGAMVLLLYSYVGLTAAVYISIPIVAPIAMTGFYSYQGMNFIEVVKLKLHFLFRNKPLLYQSTESVDEIKEYKQIKEGKLDEVKYIFRSIQRNKKRRNAII